MLTVSVQEYDIADVRAVFGEEAESTCSTEPRSADEIRARCGHNEKDHHERTNP